MALIRCNTSGGGNADYSQFFDNATSVGQSGNNISYTFTVGKTYFIAYSRGGTVTDLGVQSGATTLSSSTATISAGGTSNYPMFFAIITATSATVAIKGTSNKVVVSQLD